MRFVLESPHEEELDDNSSKYTYFDKMLFFHNLLNLFYSNVSFDYKKHTVRVVRKVIVLFIEKLDSSCIDNNSNRSAS